MSIFKAKRLTGLVLVILVSVGLIANLMKESEKQKLGRSFGSGSAPDCRGLSKNGCKIKLTLAYIEAMASLLNSSRFDNPREFVQRRMELTTIEKQIGLGLKTEC